MEPVVTEPNPSVPQGPAQSDPPTGSWAQPPATSGRSSGPTSGWAQPASAPRRLHGSTEARQWQPNDRLAALAEAAADAGRRNAAGEPEVASLGRAPARTFTPTVQTCPRCGGKIDFDGYCTQCGAKAPSVRDHFEQTPAPWVAGVCDRGLRHPQNEDAMALDVASETDARAVLVVCDGVSTSQESGRASLAAARAASGHITAQRDWNWDLADLGPLSATRRLLNDATQRANQAVLDSSAHDLESPASCTLAIGMVSGRQLLAATLGDSRVYWLPDHGATQLLSIDDSVAQEQIAGGVARQQAETGRYAHVITRWLGRDAPDTTPRLVHTMAEGPGWLLVCSDGLWNYASEPAVMGRLVAHFAATSAARAGAEPLALARALVDWANEQGGHDNITAALARLDGPVTQPGEQAASATPTDDEVPTTRTRPVASAGPAHAS